MLWLMGLKAYAVPLDDFRVDLKCWVCVGGKFYGIEQVSFATPKGRQVKGIFSFGRFRHEVPSRIDTGIYASGVVTLILLLGFGLHKMNRSGGGGLPKGTMDPGTRRIRPK